MISVSESIFPLPLSHMVYTYNLQVTLLDYHCTLTAVAQRCVDPAISSVHLNGITAVVNNEELTAYEARDFCAADDRTLPLLSDENGATIAKWVTGECDKHCWSCDIFLPVAKPSRSR